MGQLLSVPLLIAGVAIILWAQRAPVRCSTLIESALGRKIARRIRAEGPLSVAAYMAMALHDPEDGYYARHAPIGARGDFITAPEISQVFGELIGLWCAVVWRQLGRPDPVILVELGPGRGVLMSDLLRAAATVPDFRRAVRLHLVETSAQLRARAGTATSSICARLGAAFRRSAGRPDAARRQRVPGRAADSPVRPTRRPLVRAHGDSRRRESSSSSSMDRRARSEPCWFPKPCARGPRKGPSSRFAPAALALAAALGARFSRHAGAALLIDYGYFPSAPGPTLRALCRHRAVSELAAPGTADLSAHVDFAAFAEAARSGGAEAYGPVPQARLLTALGAVERAAALRERATPSQQQALDRGVERLLDPSGMGTLFKAIAVVSPGLPTPPGFDAGL